VPYEMGERLKQSDLADTLQLIADQGPDAFYRGTIAEKIAAEMETGGGLIDMEALAAYQPTVREPLRGEYRGYGIVTMPPPSSGGVHVLQMLNVLSHFPVAAMGSGSADKVHVLAEVMRLAYADRSKHLGDPDFYNVPVDWLTSPGYADRDGNVVSNTYTLNLSYGSAISVSGAGFLLNNEMDDFVSKPGVPNAFGLLGGKANSIAAGKRPLSSMTPTIVFADGEPWFATGSPGGSYIITAVLQMIVNVIDHGMNIADASSRPRMHHQWFPDLLRLESGFSPDTIRLLRERGHSVKTPQASMGSVQTTAYKDGTFRGAADPRRPNAGAAAPVEINATSD